MDGAPTTAQREEARRRFFELKARPKGAAQRELQDWLRENPAHMAAWTEVETLWQQTAAPGQRLAKLEAAELAVYLEAMDKRQGRARSLRNAALGLCLLLGIGLTGGVWLKRPHMWQDLTADYVTQRSERREITLADGSMVLLDADSALRVDITADERRIELSRGAASFRVTHSATLFRVQFGEGEITVYGTVFDVQLREDGGLVILQEGSVAISYPEMAAPQMLVPGEQFARSAGDRFDVTKVEIADVTGWRDGRFVFELMRLGDLIATLERYSVGRFIITDGALADRRVSGSLDLDRPEAALRSLRDTLGFTVTQLPGPVTILRP